MFTINLLYFQRTEVDIISAGLEGSVASIGGFCVGSSFIIDHQRLSGLGYCFSASLPPLLTQAAISALNRFESEPKIFAEIQTCSKKLHTKFEKLSKLKLGGNEISPVKHLYIKNEKDATTEKKLLADITDKVIIILILNVISKQFLYF